MSHRGLIVVLTVLAACEEERIRIEGGDVSFFANADACHSIVASLEPVRKIPSGVTLDVLGTDIGKDSICYEVQYSGKRGYVRGQCRRTVHIDRPNDPCR